MHVEGVLASTWTSSGTTFNFESIDLSGYSGQYITITGVLADVEWLSIVEVSGRTVLSWLRSSTDHPMSEASCCAMCFVLL